MLIIQLIDLPIVEDRVALILGATTIERYPDYRICEFSVHAPLPETIYIKIGHLESLARPGRLTERGPVTDTPIAKDEKGQVEIYKSERLYFVIYITEDPLQPTAADVLSHISFVLEHARAQKDEYTYDILPPLEEFDPEWQIGEQNV